MVTCSGVLALLATGRSGISDLLPLGMLLSNTYGAGQTWPQADSDIRRTLSTTVLQVC